MHILYIHQYFKTPEEIGCVRSYHLAKGLVENGHHVSMITSTNDKSRTKTIEGIDVHYLNVPYKNQFGFVRRIIAYLRFVYFARKEASLFKNVDLAYVVTTPLTTGLIALYLKKKFNIPFFFEVGDLWPEAPIQIGAIKNTYLKRKLYAFEKRCYFEASKVIALSPAIRNYIEKVSPQTAVFVLPNFSNCELFEPRIRFGSFSKDRPFQVAYIGTYGKANALRVLIKTAEKCEKRGLPMQFNLMGEGAEENSLKRLSNGIKNVTFHRAGSQYDVKALLETQDAVYVSFDPSVEILNTGSPNKFFDGLSAGKLIIINFEGWILDVIQKNQCGIYAPTPEQFIEQIVPFLSNSSMLIKYQKNARQVAEKYYAIDLQVKKLLKILNNERQIELGDSEVFILTA